VTLLQQRVLVLDCQATGASPKHGSLLEVGWLAMRPADDDDAPAAPSSTLVRLPGGAGIPPMVQKLTGLSIEDLAGAPPAAEVWARLRAAAAEIADDEGIAIAVIHFARFERSFLEPLHAELDPQAAFPLRTVCTHEIARRLLPGIPRRGLTALAGYFGLGKGELLRADGHVEATAFVWRHLASDLTREGIATFAELDAFLQRPAPKAGKRVYPMPREKRLRLPDEPGVYRMLRSSGDVLYVGKATSLRRRVNTYFQKQTGIPDRMLVLLSQARDIDVTPTRTPLEAALLESDEIKRWNPPYNVALKQEGRAAWFAGPGLRELAAAATARARVGPLGSAWYVRRWQGLKLALTSSTFDDATRDAVRVAARAPFETTDDALRDGLTAFASSLTVDMLDVRAAMALGARLWREQLAAGVAQTEIDDEAEAAADEDWDAQKVREKLDEVVVTLAHVVRRAGWLRRLSESSIAFSEGDASRLLVVERGRIVDASDREPDRELPVPPGRDRTYRDRRRSFDVPTFDRLRVLTTELRRLVEAGNSVRVRLGAPPPLADDRLRRILRWV
jgi:DNA polymerase-3 subunit epsilon